MAFPKVNSKDFYEEYHGHQVHHLQSLYPLLRATTKGIIWTAGDSSLGKQKNVFHSSSDFLKNFALTYFFCYL